MKKVLCLLVLCAMLVSCCACGKKGNDAEPTAAATAAATAGNKEEATTAPVAEPTEEPTAAPIEDEGDGLFIEFKLDDDGKPYNGVEDGPEIVNYGGMKETYVDEKTGLRVAKLTGGTSDYNVLLEDYYDDMTEAFTLETYFMCTEFPASGYWAIADNCEAGGFGIELHAGGIAKWNIYLDGAYYTTDCPIQLNTWYHLVYTWDGSMVNTYLNGKLVDSYDSDFGFMQFTTIDSAMYLCIGACCNANAHGGNGMKGSMGVCNMYTTALSEEAVAARYEALMNP